MSLAGFHVGGYLGYLRPRSRLYWPPYLQRFAASSVISGIQLANTAYTPTIIRCRQNRALAWVSCFILFFFFYNLLFALTFAFQFLYLYICICTCDLYLYFNFRQCSIYIYVYIYRFHSYILYFMIIGFVIFWTPKTIHARNASLSAHLSLARILYEDYIRFRIIEGK